MQSLSERLKELVRAAFSGLWVQTYEPDEAQKEIARLCDAEQWACEVWDVAQGFHQGGGAGDPMIALSSGKHVMQDSAQTCLVVLHNFHKFLNSAMVLQKLINNVVAGKQDRTFWVVLSHSTQIPPEAEKLFVVVEHPLPDVQALNEIAHEVEHGREEFASDVDLRAANGLTRYEAEGAFALSLVRHDAIRPDVVWEMKAQLLKKSGLLELHQGQEKFSDLGGLENVKQFCKKAIPERHKGKPQARGVMLLGVPGTGKSAFAKALGNEVGRPTLTMDVGSFYGSLVGQTEERIRQALKIVDAMAPAVLFIDEIEKALAGVGSNGDSGTSTRLFGTLLTWLSDHTSDVFVVATSNDVSKLPPEFTRAERWDGVFFLDLPTRTERAAIWDQYVIRYEIDRKQPCPIAYPDDEQWTGAEIKSCCRLAALLDIPLAEAAQNVVPVAVTAPEKVSALREWADGRCLSASSPGVFRKDAKNGNGMNGVNGKRRAITQKGG